LYLSKNNFGRQTVDNNSDNEKESSDEERNKSNNKSKQKNFKKFMMKKEKNKEKAKLIKIRYGLCSNYLAQLSPSLQSTAYLQVHPSCFRLPPNPTAPILMIAAGTGIAPFMAFLDELNHIKNNFKPNHDVNDNTNENETNKNETNNNNNNNNNNKNGR